jgi:hypothetical protein
MKRTHIAALLAVGIAISAAATGPFLPSNAQPCFIAGDTSYRIANRGAADVTVRIDNTATKPDLRLQQVDDSAMADFVLVDDSDTVNGCTGAVQSIRLDPAAANADLTVTLSRAPAAYKIYVRSGVFSEQDAAALFAAMWDSARKNTHASGSGREFVARN